MGRIIKYDKTKTNTSRVLSPVVSTGGYPTNTGGIINEQSANLWGNDFHGYEDLSGSMLIQGDITIDWDEDDYDDSLYDEEEGDEIPTGSLYVKNKVEAKSVYGKSIFLDYPELDNKKTNLLDILKETQIHLDNIDKATIWGQGLKSNNYIITGNMSNVGDINFSGESKVIGSMTNSNVRPNNIYSNSNVVVSSYNGNPWDYSLMKYIGAATFLNNNSLQLHSVVDYYNDGNYYNNPRILWNIYNPKTVQREGHWWLGHTWHNGDINRYGSDNHKNFMLYPSFEVPDDMKGDDGNPKSDYFNQFNFTINSNVTSMSFIKHSGKSTEFLMADGSTKELKDLGFASPDEIPNVPTKVSQLQNDVPFAEYDKNDPVILFSGVIHANNNDGSQIYQPFVVRPNMYSQHRGVKEITLNYLEVNGEKKPTLVIDVLPKDGYTVKATSIHTSVSLNQHCNPTTDFGGNRRSQGYWTTGGVFPTDGKMYIQAWRTDDDNNDSTVNDVIAWSVIEMNITIFGKAYKN